MPDTNARARRAAPPSLTGERVVVVGPGRVGLSLACWLSSRGARLVALSGRRRPAALDSVKDTVKDKVQGGAPDAASWRPLESLSSADADLLIVAVSDPALETVAEQLAARPQAPVALHVSGHFDAQALAPLRASSEVGSWHPLRAFTAPSADAGEAQGVTFAIDGDAGAVAAARRLTEALGGHAVYVSGMERRLYHLAASLAAGGVVTVLAAVDELRRRAGLPDELMVSYLHLTRGALDQLPVGEAVGRAGESIAAGAIAAAITGPAARGDADMLARQGAAVASLAPDLLPLIQALNEATRELRSEAPNPGAGPAVRAPVHR